VWCKIFKYSRTYHSFRKRTRNNLRNRNGAPESLPKRRFCFYPTCWVDYPALIALTGQVSTQAPQSMQVSPSMARLSPTSLIALTGQESSHAPQLMHSSEIL
jgi:hypothetical protein